VWGYETTIYRVYFCQKVAPRSLRIKKTTEGGNHLSGSRALCSLFRERKTETIFSHGKEQKQGKKGKQSLTLEQLN